MSESFKIKQVLYKCLAKNCEIKLEKQYLFCSKENNMTILWQGWDRFEFLTIHFSEYNKGITILNFYIGE